MREEGGKGRAERGYKRGSRGRELEYSVERRLKAGVDFIDKVSAFNPHCTKSAVREDFYGRLAAGWIEQNGLQRRCWTLNLHATVTTQLPFNTCIAISLPTDRRAPTGTSMLLLTNRSCGMEWNGMTRRKWSLCPLEARTGSGLRTRRHQHSLTHYAMCPFLARLFGTLSWAGVGRAGQAANPTPPKSNPTTTSGMDHHLLIATDRKYLRTSKPAVRIGTLGPVIIYKCTCACIGRTSSRTGYRGHNRPTTPPQSHAISLLSSTQAKLRKSACRDLSRA